MADNEYVRADTHGIALIAISMFLTAGVWPYRSAAKGGNTTDVWSAIEHVSTDATIPLALIGFGITFWQLARTRRAASAAQIAAENATHRIATDNLTGLINRLDLFEERLTYAAKDGNPELISLILRDWNQHAMKTRSLIELLRPQKEEEIKRVIQRSIAAASSAKDRIRESPNTDPAKAAMQVCKTISAMSAQLYDLTLPEGTETRRESQK